LVLVEGLDDGGQPPNLGHMLLGEPAKHSLALAGYLYSDQPPITGVGLTVDEPRGGGPVDELADAVVAQHQVVGHIGDGGSLVDVTFDGEQELMLGRGQPHVACRLLTPAQEAAQLLTEVEQPFVVGLAGRCHRLIQARFAVRGHPSCRRRCDRRTPLPAWLAS